MFIIFAERVSPGAHGDGHLNISHIRAVCRQLCWFRRHCSESDLHPSGQLFHKTAIVAIRSVGFDSVVNKATKSYVTYSTYMFCSSSAAGVGAAPVGPV